MSSILRGRIVNGQDGRPRVAVDGAVIDATFLTGYVPNVGDAVRVLRADGEAFVLGAALPFTPPHQGTVASSSGGLSRIITDAGAIDARYVGSAPANLSTVRLDWTSNPPWVAGVISAAPAAPDDDTGDSGSAPRPPAATGTLSLPATSSGSWRPPPGFARWEAGDVRQGRFGSGQPYEGTWIYSDARLRSLRGRDITRLRLRLPARSRIGNFNQSAPVSIRRRNNNNTGNPPNLSGTTHTVTVPANAGPRWITLPNSIGEALVAGGGGLVLTGSTYAGFAGRRTDPASGQLQITWRR